VFARLLLGVGPTDAGEAIGRLAEVSLIGLAVACWPSRVSMPQTRQPAVALLMFSVICAVFLAFLGVTEKTVGLLLWPAAMNTVDAPGASCLHPTHGRLTGSGWARLQENLAPGAHRVTRRFA